MSQLAEQHFQVHPIWSEYYDYDERGEIISWGIDPAWLNDELEAVHDGNDHCAYPVLRLYPLPVRMRLYIKATFQTPEGRMLDGFVVNDDAYAITIFFQGEQFIFSKCLSDLAEKECARLGEALTMDGEAIFPLSYVTDFKGHDGRIIQGVFNPFGSRG
ncbi:MAG: hypothetical protein AAGJ10_05970 [Bacteroidota bacterium]